MSGLPDFRDWLDALPADLLEDVTADGVQVACDIIADEWKARSGSSEVRGSIGTIVENEGDRIVGKVRSIGPGSYIAPWEEFGTLPHVIMARERGSTGIGKSGAALRGSRTINRKIRRGALVINGTLVGDLVHHPGAEEAPALRPALDAKRQEAFEAMQGRITSRLAGRIA